MGGPTPTGDNAGQPPSRLRPASQLPTRHTIAANRNPEDAARASNQRAPRAQPCHKPAGTAGRLSPRTGESAVDGAQAPSGEGAGEKQSPPGAGRALKAPGGAEVSEPSICPPVNLIARSRSSSGYFRGAAILDPPWLDGVHQTRHKTEPLLPTGRNGVQQTGQVIMPSSCDGTARAARAARGSWAGLVAVGAAELLGVCVVVGPEPVAVARQLQDDAAARGRSSMTAATISSPRTEPQLLIPRFVRMIDVLRWRWLMSWNSAAAASLGRARCQARR